MTLILTFASFFVAISFGLGLYFRIAEYDVLASEKVWERIAPAALAIVDDEGVPDEIAAMVAAFSMLTGCGCFVNSVLIDSIKSRLGFSIAAAAEDLRAREQIGDLAPEVRHALALLLQDLLIFDSLHAPILGRLCRVLNRDEFSRDRYRRKTANPEKEREVIFRITTAAETAIERKSDPRAEFALA